MGKILVKNQDAVVVSGEVSGISKEGVMAHWKNVRNCVELELRVTGGE